MKTSFVFVFRKHLQDVLIKTNIFALVIRLQKASSRRLQDVLIQTNIFVLVIRLQDVFKTSCKRVFQTSSRRLKEVLKSFQDFFKISSRPLAKTSCKSVFKKSSRCLQEVLKTSSRLPQDIFKTSYKDVFKTFSRPIIRLNCLPRSRICLGHASQKFVVSVEILQV